MGATSSPSSGLGFLCCGTIFALFLLWCCRPLIGWFFSLFRTSRCEICSVAFKRSRHQWEIEGKKKWVCPNCNRSLEAAKSRAAVAMLKGKLVEEFVLHPTPPPIPAAAANVNVWADFIRALAWILVILCALGFVVLVFLAVKLAAP